MGADNFLEWKRSHNDGFSTDVYKQVPDDLLQSTDPSELCKWLKLYLTETRKKDSSPYPSKTIYLLLTGFFRCTRLQNLQCLNFFRQVQHLDYSLMMFNLHHLFVFHCRHCQGVQWMSIRAKLHFRLRLYNNDNCDFSIHLSISFYKL